MKWVCLAGAAGCLPANAADRPDQGRFGFAKAIILPAEGWEEFSNIQEASADLFCQRQY